MARYHINNNKKYQFSLRFQSFWLNLYIQETSITKPQIEENNLKKKMVAIILIIHIIINNRIKVTIIKHSNFHPIFQ